MYFRGDIMNCVLIRFYGELNDLISPDYRQSDFEHCFNGQPSIKDLVESTGVPHTEIELILVNGRSVDFSCQITGGEQISVYPAFSLFDMTAVTKVRLPLSEVRFVLDDHLGKLTSYLRMIGSDAVNLRDLPLGRRAAAESFRDRILLTCDKNLLKQKKVAYGYYIRNRDPEKQLIEVMNRFNLINALNPFGRCMICNDLLTPVSKDVISSRLPQLVQESVLEEFYQCPGCGRLYWKGTHYEHMDQFISEIKRKITDP
jgi:uncharacterized protein